MKRPSGYIVAGQWTRWHTGPSKGEPGAQGARLFLFGGAWSSDALAERVAKDPSVQLIGLDRLYYGS
jgi:hypothetical protein